MTETTESDCAEAGRIVWHSSELEAGSPDVGRSLGLGGGWVLWIGEISRSAWEDGGPDVESLGSDFGTWIILYGPDKSNTKIIGKAVDGYVGEDLLTLIARGMLSRPLPSSSVSGG